MVFLETPLPPPHTHIHLCLYFFFSQENFKNTLLPPLFMLMLVVKICVNTCVKWENIYWMLLLTHLPLLTLVPKHTGAGGAQPGSVWLLPGLITFHMSPLVSAAAPDLPFVPLRMKVSGSATPLGHRDSVLCCWRWKWRQEITAGAFICPAAWSLSLLHENKAEGPAAPLTVCWVGGRVRVERTWALGPGAAVRLGVPQLPGKEGAVMLPQGPAAPLSKGSRWNKLCGSECWHSWESFKTARGQEGEGAGLQQELTCKGTAPWIPEAFLFLLLLPLKDSRAGRPLLSKGWPTAKSVARSPRDWSQWSIRLTNGEKGSVAIGWRWLLCLDTLVLGGTLRCFGKCSGSRSCEAPPWKGGRGEGWTRAGNERKWRLCLGDCRVAAAGRLLAVESHVLRYSADIHQSSWRLVEGRWCWIPQVWLSSKMPCPLIKNN